MKSEWQAKKVKEVCDDIKLDRAPVGTNPYVEIGDINIATKKITVKRKGSVRGSICAKRNSIIVSKVRPTRGAITILEEDMVISSAFSVPKT
jgi:type I restriction enzyme, S subunit